MYKFDNCYWIVHSYSEYDGVVQDCGIRRCNNMLKIVDPLNGSIFSIPCVVDYDMAASTVKVTKYILTPNNHAVIMVQGNENTLRLFKANSRFILSGRPFKLYGYQNAVEFDLDAPSTLLYLDLYLDEVRDGDNLELGVAENGQYDYSISINSQDLTLLTDSTGNLSSNVLLNGMEVDRDVIWYSSNDKIVAIDNNGDYIVHGEIGDSVDITAFLNGNSDVYDSINITIGDTSQVIDIILDPEFNIIRQYETIKFKVKAYYNGEPLEDEDIDTSVAIDSSILNVAKLTNNCYILTSVGVSSDVQNLTINVLSESLQFEKTVTLGIKAVSMLG